MNASPEQKQRLQRAFFPEGLRFKDGRFGTAVTCLAFKQMSANSEGDSSLASQIFTSWNQIVAWLKRIETVRQAA